MTKEFIWIGALNPAERAVVHQWISIVESGGTPTPSIWENGPLLGQLLYRAMPNISAKRAKRTIDVTFDALRAMVDVRKETQWAKK